MSDKDSEIGAREASLGIAKAILHDRVQRRKLVFQAALLLVFSVLIGYWPLERWLSESVWRFLVWWGAVGLLTLWVLLMAFYDMVRVVAEERDKLLSQRPEKDDERG